MKTNKTSMEKKKKKKVQMLCHAYELGTLVVLLVRH